MSLDNIPFRFNGRQLFGQPEDTIATALLRNDIRVFDRSIKRRRKRGVSCFEGYCMSCFLEVNGEADVLACQTPLRSAMDVRSQVAMPSPSFDIRAPLQSVAFRIFGPELYYRLFTSRAWLSELWMHFLARMAGRGRLADPGTYNQPLPFETHHVDILVVGGGVAGIASAYEACCEGVNKVMLVDRGTVLGGAYSRWKAVENIPEPFEPLDESLPSLPPDVHVLSSTTLLALYEDRTALAVGEEAAHRIHYDSVIIAAGCYPNVLSFKGSDSPLYLPAQGLLRAVADTGWAPHTAILLDVDGYGKRWKQMLESVGTEVRMEEIAVSDCLAGDVRALDGTKESGIQLPSGVALNAEVVCWSAGSYPRTELIRMAGGTVLYREARRQFLPRLEGEVRVAANTFAAGGCAGTEGFRSAFQHGRLAGSAAVEQLRTEQKESTTSHDQAGTPHQAQGGAE